MNEKYHFTPQDGELLWAAAELLRKVMVSGKIRPAQMATLAKLQHVFSVLPCATESVTASVSVCSPKHKFGEIETFHWWEFGTEGETLKIESAGCYCHPQTGSDSFTTMTWRAEPECPSEFCDFSANLSMVPDLRTFPEGVESIDFTAEEYKIEVLDEDNLLLREFSNEEDEGQVEDEEDEDAGEIEPDFQQNLFSKEDELCISVELYRPNEIIEVSQKEWQMSLLIFQEMGWQPVRPIERYSNPLAFVMEDEGKAMQRAGRSLFTLIDGEPGVATSIQMDIGLLYRLTGFVGGGAFMVGRPGSYENAQANDF